MYKIFDNVKYLPDYFIDKKEIELEDTHYDNNNTTYPIKKIISNGILFKYPFNPVNKPILIYNNKQLIVKNNRNKLYNISEQECCLIVANFLYKRFSNWENPSKKKIAINNIYKQLKDILSSNLQEILNHKSWKLNNIEDDIKNIKNIFKIFYEQWEIRNEERKIERKLDSDLKKNNKKLSPDKFFKYIYPWYIVDKYRWVIKNGRKVLGDAKQVIEPIMLFTKTKNEKEIAKLKIGVNVDDVEINFKGYEDKDLPKPIIYNYNTNKFEFSKIRYKIIKTTSHSLIARYTTYYISGKNKVKFGSINSTINLKYLNTQNLLTEKKFDATNILIKNYDKVINKIYSDCLENNKDSIKSFAAYLLHKTKIRPGSETKSSSIGLLTLQKNKHISVINNNIKIKFLGKAGVNYSTIIYNKDITDTTEKQVFNKLIEYIKKVDNNKKLFNINLNKYLKQLISEITGKQDVNITAKYFRTAQATDSINKNFNDNKNIKFIRKIMLDKNLSLSEKKVKFNKFINPILIKIGNKLNHKAGVIYGTKKSDNDKKKIKLQALQSEIKQYKKCLEDNKLFNTKLKYKKYKTTDNKIIDKEFTCKNKTVSQKSSLKRKIEKLQLEINKLNSGVVGSTAKAAYIDPRSYIKFGKLTATPLNILYSSADIIKNNWALMTPQKKIF